MSIRETCHVWYYSVLKFSVSSVVSARVGNLG